MNRIHQTFAGLRRRNRKAFIAYLTAGYPSLDVTEKLIIEFARIGVDIVEIGVPFSDPLADGPVIQEASQAALKNGVHIKEILAMVRRIRKKTQMPVALMTYYNPVFCYGEGAFVKDCVSVGVDGLIMPDLPPEEAQPISQKASRVGLDIVCFLAPTSRIERIKMIGRKARGFIYYVSLTGVTGARQGLAAGLGARVKTIKQYTSKPVCVGFGISTRKQVREVSRYADGVIVGSAIVKKIRDCIGGKSLVPAVSRYVRSLMI